MNDWTIFIYALESGAALMLTGLGLVLAVIMPSIDQWSKRFFIVFFSVLFLHSCVALAENIFTLIPAAGAVRVADAFLSLASVPLLMLTVFLLHCCGENWRKSLHFRAVLALEGLYILLLAAAQFSSLFYYVTPDAHFHFGPWYSLLVCPTAAIELVNLDCLFRRRKALTRKHFLAMLISLLPLTVALLVHLFIPVFPLIDIGIGISALSMYAIILSEQVGQYLRQQREIAHEQAGIMVLQMRPHFIHNTMLSIYYLCEQNPREAQRVTLDFNTYLEKSLAALASDEAIPFSEELEHTRAYLNVEQALYDESLFVDYDTPHTSFQVPPLTVQPIVENAVKHALDPDSRPLRISIQTRKTDLGSEITVSDNGPGFDPAGGGKTHTALDNIRQRLELMCGGSMTISPREGGGTVVKLAIPWTASAANQI